MAVVFEPGQDQLVGSPGTGRKAMHSSSNAHVYPLLYRGNMTCSISRASICATILIPCWVCLLALPMQRILNRCFGLIQVSDWQWMQPSLASAHKQISLQVCTFCLHSECIAHWSGLQSFPSQSNGWKKFLSLDKMNLWALRGQEGQSCTRPRMPTYTLSELQNDTTFRLRYISAIVCRA